MILVNRSLNAYMCQSSKVFTVISVSVPISFGLTSLGVTMGKGV